MIGLLLYIILETHPNVAFVVINLLQFVANPFKNHLVKTLYIYHYLIDTSEYRIIYSGRKQRGLAYANKPPLLGLS